MNIKFCIISILLSLMGCKSIPLPSIEESQKSIDMYKSSIDSVDRAVKMKRLSLPAGNDIILRINISGINKILEAFANNREDDININFLPTRPVFSEEKSIIGISYTNFLNIDDGFVSTNLKKIRFDKANFNKLNATIEIEGKGNLSVSGKYLGIPASVSPEIQLYLYEPISFGLIPAESGSVIFSPLPQQLTLKTKFTVNLLGWKVPWYQEVSLELTDLLKPLKVPLALKPVIQFPLPAKTFGDQKIEFAPYLLNFNNTKVSAGNDKIEFRTDIDFERKR